LGISIAILLWYYSKSSQLNWMASLKAGWALGLIMGVFFGLAFLSLESASEPGIETSLWRPDVLPFVLRGAIFGLANAVLISVFPFIITWRAFAGTAPGTARKIGVTLLACVFIMLMSFLNILGTAGFNDQMQNNITKSMIASIPTIISGNPLAAPISNIFLQVSESVASSEQAAGNQEKITTAKSKTAPGGID
jgi:hypothetical protein